MKEIISFINNFTKNGGMLYVIIGIFLIGFGIKTVGSLCYDDILDKIENFQMRTSKRVENIIIQYKNEIKFGKNINNSQAFVERSMHGWKIKGIFLEKMQAIGDIFGKLCLILGICAVVILLATQKEEVSLTTQTLKGAYIYAAVSTVLFICLKLWDNVIALEYKRDVIRDEIINYLDNNQAVDVDNIPVVNVEIKELQELEKESVEQTVSENMETINLTLDHQMAKDEVGKNVKQDMIPENQEKKNILVGDKEIQKIFDEILEEFLS